MQINEAAARKIRKILAQLVGVQVEAVAWIQRSTNLEFAAFVVRGPHDEEKVLEFLTDPRCHYAVTRQTASRIFIEAVQQ
jgi:hypothetical protein